ncbi:MAG: hypothetical protein NZO16_00765 [Deltaproteobacteria bacterium]|nr:hypothetical protein [Deltaproteobacteria bacterium]
MRECSLEPRSRARLSPKNVSLGKLAAVVCLVLGLKSNLGGVVVESGFQQGSSLKNILDKIQKQKADFLKFTKRLERVFGNYYFDGNRFIVFETHRLPFTCFYVYPRLNGQQLGVVLYQQPNGQPTIAVAQILPPKPGQHATFSVLPLNVPQEFLSGASIIYYPNGENIVRIHLQQDPEFGGSHEEILRALNNNPFDLSNTDWENFENLTIDYNPGRRSTYGAPAGLPESAINRVCLPVSDGYYIINPGNIYNHFPRDADDSESLNLSREMYIVSANNPSSRVDFKGTFNGLVDQHNNPVINLEDGKKVVFNPKTGTFNPFQGPSYKLEIASSNSPYPSLSGDLSTKFPFIPKQSHFAGFYGSTNGESTTTVIFDPRNELLYSVVSEPVKGNRIPSQALRSWERDIAKYIEHLISQGFSNSEAVNQVCKQFDLTVTRENYNSSFYCEKSISWPPSPESDLQGCIILVTIQLDENGQNKVSVGIRYNYDKQ